MNFNEMRKALKNKLAKPEIDNLKEGIIQHKKYYNKSNEYSIQKENERLADEILNWNTGGWKKNGRYKQPVKHKLY